MFSHFDRQSAGALLTRVNTRKRVHHLSYIIYSLCFLQRSLKAHTIKKRLMDYKRLSLWKLKISFITILLGVSLFANNVALYRKPMSPGISDGTTTRRVPSRLLPSSYLSEVSTIYLSYETPMRYV